jgi:hypothetical protein
MFCAPIERASCYPLSQRKVIGICCRKEREKTVQISPVNNQGTHASYDQAEVEAREQKLERDLTGAHLPKGYWVSWMILIILVVVGLIVLSVFHLI